jgi:N-acetylglutamate synthase-like GNAT family acetyltransferase
MEPARQEDLHAMQDLLGEEELPADVEPHLPDFLVARHRGRVVGCVGMEIRGLDALFRSLAVMPAYRGLGLARRLYEALLEQARTKGVERAYLLTKTIAPLAEAWGFRRLEPTQVPTGIQETSEFRGACCASAVAMWRDLHLPVRTGPCSR